MHITNNNHPGSPGLLRLIFLPFISCLLLLVILGCLTSCTMTRDELGNLTSITIDHDSWLDLLTAAERAADSYAALEADIEAAKEKDDKDLLRELLIQEIALRQAKLDAEAKVDAAVKGN